MATIFKETLKTIQAHRNDNPHYLELLDILEEILILREEYRRKVTKQLILVDENLIKKKISGGLPLVDFSNKEIDLSEPKKYFMALLEIAKKRAPEETKEILSGLENGTIDYGEIARESFDLQTDKDEESENSSDEEEDQVFDLLSFLIEESLRPSLEILIEKYGHIIKESAWQEGYCPVCSREPKISALKKEGERYLFCNQCGFEWNFKRVMCAFCGNEDNKTLAYFSAEGEEQYRVDVCNKCKRYIKVVDYRKTAGEPNLDVEDIATLHLDILANEEGYE